MLLGFLPEGLLSASARAGLIGGLACTAMLAPAWSQTSRWIDAGGGFYDAASNWNPAAVPSATSELLFDLPGVYTVSWDEITSDRIAASLRADGGVGVGPFPEVTLASDTDPDIFQLELEPSGFGNALTVRRNASLIIGVPGQPNRSLEVLTAGSSNRVEIVDSGSLTVADGSTLRVGTSSAPQSVSVTNASLRLTGGGQLSAGTVSILNSDALGGALPNRIESGSVLDATFLRILSTETGAASDGTRLEVDGVGSEVRVSGFSGLELDSAATTASSFGAPGEIAISGGAALTTTRLQVGQDTGRGVLTLTGTGTSAAVSGFTAIGGGLRGEVRVEAGATLSTDSSVDLNDRATITVTGAGSRWDAGGSVEVLADVAVSNGSQPAELQVLDGAVMEMTGRFGRGLELGNDFSDGRLVIEGSGSALVGNGSSIYANGALSQVRVANGGALTASSLRLRNDAGLVIGSGGRVELALLDQTDGRVVFVDGQLALTGTLAVFRFRPGVTGDFAPTFDDNNTFSNAGTSIIDPGASVVTSSANGFAPGALINDGALSFVNSSGTPYVTTLSSASYRGDGRLSVGDDVTLRAADAAPFTLRGSTFVNTDGTLESASGVVLDAGSSLRVQGNVVGPVIGDRGSVIRARGLPEIGDATSPIGLATDGQLIVESLSSLDVLDANRAQLGLLTEIDPTSTITATNGLVLDAGENLVGGFRVQVGFDQPRSFINNGEVSGVSSSEPLRLGGYVQGVGVFEDVVFESTFAPGLSPAAVTLGAADYAGTLEIELGGTNPGSEHDQVNHTLGAGTAELGGTLDVSLLPGFAPEADDAFTVLTATNGFTGAFDEVRLPALAGGLTWDVQASVNAITLAVVGTAGLIGDYNDSGTVEQGDLNLVLTNWGTARTFSDPGGTAFATIIVDQEELNLVLTNWGSSSVPSFAGFDVPEPATAGWLGGVALISLRRRR